VTGTGTDSVSAADPSEVADPIAGTQASYAAMAGRYADRWDAAETFWGREAMERFAPDLPAGALVADVGCGPGNDTVRLRGLGLRTHGFDLSHAMLTSRDVPGQVRADLRKLPLPDGALDGLWCIAVLLHLPRDMMPAALAEFHRVLRPGGLATISIAEGDGAGWESYPFQEGVPDRYFVYHSREAFTALITAAGFEILSATGARTHRNWVALHVRRDAGVH
jgi:ubiquinone/menaquinone biosynthesis C-methylase UbiE